MDLSSFFLRWFLALFFSSTSCWREAVLHHGKNELGSMASATKPHLFFLCTWYLENGDLSVLRRWHSHHLNDLFLNGFWTVLHSFCQKDGQALDFQVLGESLLSWHKICNLGLYSASVVLSIKRTLQ